VCVMDYQGKSDTIKPFTLSRSQSDSYLQTVSVGGTDTLVVYYESIKRELKIRPTYDCRCDERLKTKTEDSTRLTYTGLHG
jgi:hypothetical protein